MITLTKKDLLSNDFKIAMTRVATCRKLDTKVAYRVMRTTKLLEGELKKVQKDFSGLVKTIAKVDVKGNPILNEDKTDYEFLEGVKKEDAVSKLESFVSAEVSIDRERFELEDFTPAELSPSDMAILEPLFNQPEV